METHPKFRKDLIVSEQPDSRNRIVIKDPVSEKFFLLTVYEYQFLRLFDGTRSLEEALDRFKTSGQYCSPDDGKMILGKAAQLGLLLGTRFGTAQFQKYLRERYNEARRARLFSSVYFLFIPLVNPDRFLERTLWIYNLVANRITMGLGLLFLPGAMYLVISGWHRMHREYTFFFNLENLLYLWITITLTKLIHELAHAYTAKQFGLHVPQMGVAFLIFFPCLFCNTTDAWQLADRKQRIAISAAGIIAEGFLAIVSAYVWYFSKPGLVNSLAFYLMAVSFISTVLFNGNPLMKFDGYFMLIDWIEKPNLQGKSFGYLKYLFWNSVLGISTVANPAQDVKESALFGVYGVCSFIYRIFLYTGIVGGVYYRFDKMIGIALALLAFSLFIVRPVLKGVSSLYAKRSDIHPRPRQFAVFVAVLVLIMLPLTIPISGNSTFPCYVASTKVQKLTVPLQTLVSDMQVRQGSTVTKGMVLYSLDTSALELTLIKKEIQRAVNKEELMLLLLDPKEKGKAPGKQLELNQAEEEIRRIRTDLKIAKDGMIAPYDGVVTALDYRMQPGFQPGEGAVVGEVQSPASCVVHALVSENDRGRVHLGQDAEIWLPVGRGGHRFSGKISSISAFGERDLRDSPFSSRLGGELATEIKGEHQRDAPLEAQYKCTVELPADGTAPYLGMTGRFMVSSPPRSILSHFLDRMYRTFTLESLM